MKKVICPGCEGAGFTYHYDDHGSWIEDCEECDGAGEVEVPEVEAPFVRTTRGDRIRNMSNKEIAEFISNFPVDSLCDVICSSNCKAMPTAEKTSDEVCKEIIQKWLEEELDE